MIWYDISYIAAGDKEASDHEQLMARLLAVKTSIESKRNKCQASTKTNLEARNIDNLSLNTVIIKTQCQDVGQLSLSEANMISKREKPAELLYHQAATPRQDTFREPTRQKEYDLIEFRKPSDAQKFSESKSCLSKEGSKAKFSKTYEPDAADEKLDRLESAAEVFIPSSRLQTHLTPQLVQAYTDKGATDIALCSISDPRSVQGSTDLKDCDIGTVGHQRHISAGSEISRDEDPTTSASGNDGVEMSKSSKKLRVTSQNNICPGDSINKDQAFQTTQSDEICNPEHSGKLEGSENLVTCMAAELKTATPVNNKRRSLSSEKMALRESEFVSLANTAENLEPEGSARRSKTEMDTGDNSSSLEIPCTVVRNVRSQESMARYSSAASQSGLTTSTPRHVTTYKLPPFRSFSICVTINEIGETLLLFRGLDLHFTLYTAFICFWIWGILQSMETEFWGLFIQAN